MKRIVYGLFVIPLILLMPMFVSAETNVPNNEDIRSYIESIYGTTYVVTDDSLNAFKNTSTNSNYSSRKVILYIDGGNLNIGFCNTWSVSPTNSSYGRIGAPYWTVNLSNVNGVNTSTTGNIGSGLISNTNLYESLDSFYQTVNESSIDYSNIFYLPQIPSADVVMKYNSLNMNNEYIVPVSAEIAPASINGYSLYLNIKARLYCADNINISFNNGQTVYEPVTLTSSDIIDVLPYGTNYSMSQEDIFTIDLNSINDGILQDAWETLRTNTNTTFSGVNSGSAQFNQAISDYNQYAKNAVTMGNRLELFFNIYLIQDNMVYQGMTLRWYSTQPSNFELSQNAYNVFDIIQSNYSVISNSVAEILEGSDTVPPNNPNYEQLRDIAQNLFGHTTLGGSGALNNNIPNNMDYPTITQFNHDNVFMMFKDYYDQASTFFGGFGEFMGAAMSWVPYDVWIIVQLGLMLGIIVMIVKVL